MIKTIAATKTFELLKYKLSQVTNEEQLKIICDNPSKYLLEFKKPPPNKEKYHQNKYVNEEKKKRHVKAICRTL